MRSLGQNTRSAQSPTRGLPERKSPLSPLDLTLTKNPPITPFLSHSSKIHRPQVSSNHTLPKKGGGEGGHSFLYFLYLLYILYFTSLEETMTKKKHDPARCQYRDALNRQCRMFRLDTHPSLCYEHAKAEHIVRDAE